MIILLLHNHRLNPQNPFPLVVGNSWTYKVTSFNPDGSKKSGTGSIVYQITEDTTVNGEKWSYLKTGTSGGAYYLNRSNGVWSVINGSMNYFLKFPAKPRDMYMTLSNNIMGVVSIDSSITVPKGTFSCYEYILFQENPIADYYFSPGTGFIRIDLYEQADSIGNYINSRYELVDYTLK